MGSLRNPVGPLPSTIYWRRRVVLLSLLALLALLITWVVTSGGGGGKKDDGANGKTPAPTITAGPSGSGPAISQAPGGRDESSGGGSGSDAGGSGSGGSSGSGGDGSGSGAGTGGSGGSGGTSGTGAGGVGGGVGQGDTVPAGSTLPNCTAGAVKLSVRSLHNSYSPGDTVTLLVTAKNSSGGDCKVDLGPKSAVLTISKSTDSADDFWSSADCPKTAGSLLFRAPAGSGVTYTYKWDRKPSAPQCATPPAGSAGAGTYLVELAASGYGKTQTSFVLQND